MDAFIGKTYQRCKRLQSRETLAEVDSAGAAETESAGAAEVEYNLGSVAHQDKAVVPVM